MQVQIKEVIIGEPICIGDVFVIGEDTYLLSNLRGKYYLSNFSGVSNYSGYHDTLEEVLISIKEEFSVYSKYKYKLTLEVK